MPRGVSRYDEAALQGRLWTPAQLRSGDLLGLWLDASDVSTITASSGAVSQWNDKSGLGNHVSQATGAKQPTLSYARQNGLPALTFSAHNLVKNTPAGFGTASSGNAAAFAVAKMANVSSFHAISALGQASNLNTGHQLLSTSTGAFGSYYWANDNIATPFTDTTQFHIFGGDYSASPARKRVFLDNVTVSATETGNDYRNVTSITIGVQSDLVNSPMAGDIGEVIILAGPAKDATLQRIQGYLAWKWDLVANLSADHPYKNRPPLIGA